MFLPKSKKRNLPPDCARFCFSLVDTHKSMGV
ncbi:hypothetical protein EMIT0347P_20547 [Pseudomonas sp. IT-347P]